MSSAFLEALSAQSHLSSIGLCGTTVFWTGNLRRHHSSLLFGFWPAAPAKLRSKMGISATMYTTAHKHAHTHTHTLLARKNRHQPHSICNLLLHRETLEWLRGSALSLCVCVLGGVWGPRDLSAIHQGWAEKSSTRHLKALLLLLSRSLLQALPLFFFVFDGLRSCFSHNKPLLGKAFSTSQQTHTYIYNGQRMENIFLLFHLFSVIGFPPRLQCFFFLRSQLHLCRIERQNLQKV